MNNNIAAAVPSAITILPSLCPVDFSQKQVLRNAGQRMEGPEFKS